MMGFAKSANRLVLTAWESLSAYPVTTALIFMVIRVCHNAPVTNMDQIDYAWLAPKLASHALRSLCAALVSPTTSTDQIQANAFISALPYSSETKAQ